MSATVSYNLTGSGWSECTVVIDEQYAKLGASYLSDAFGDLMAAMIRLVEGQPEATTSFAEEPGEYRWRFFRRDPDRLFIRILEFPQLWGDRPDEDGKPVLEAECRLRSFAGAVLSESQRLLEEHGLQGYLEKWVEHEFPLEKHERLRQLLCNPAHPDQPATKVK